MFVGVMFSEITLELCKGVDGMYGESERTDKKAFTDCGHSGCKVDASVVDWVGARVLLRGARSQWTSQACGQVPIARGCRATSVL